MNVGGKRKSEMNEVGNEEAQPLLVEKRSLRRGNDEVYIYAI
jgi:hypothetical protein